MRYIAKSLSQLFLVLSIFTPVPSLPSLPHFQFHFLLRCLLFCYLNHIFPSLHLVSCITTHFLCFPLHSVCSSLLLLLSLSSIYTFLLILTLIVSLVVLSQFFPVHHSPNLFSCSVIFFIFTYSHFV